LIRTNKILKKVIGEHHKKRMGKKIEKTGVLQSSLIDPIQNMNEIARRIAMKQILSRSMRETCKKLEAPLNVDSLD
jgi:hypothetical protein